MQQRLNEALEAPLASTRGIAREIGASRCFVHQHTRKSGRKFYRQLAVQELLDSRIERRFLFSTKILQEKEAARESDESRETESESPRSETPPIATASKITPPVASTPSIPGPYTGRGYGSGRAPNKAHSTRRGCLKFEPCDKVYPVIKHRAGSRGLSLTVCLFPDYEGQIEVEQSRNLEGDAILACAEYFGNSQ